MGTELYMKIHNTTKFSGRKEENWETWITRFETRFGDVDETNLASVLLDVLDGAALDACGKLSKDERKTYKAVKSVLQKKFGACVDTRRANAELRQIRQLPGENAEAFANRVRKLTNVANPGLSSTQIDQAALEHFLCGLSDLRLQEKLHNDDTVLSLQKAEEVAQRLQEKDITLTAMRTAGGPDTAAVASVKQTPENETQQSTSSNQTAEILAMVGELKNELNEVKSQIRWNASQSSDALNSGSRRACFQCGDTAHFKRDCPQLTNKFQTRQQHMVPRSVPNTADLGIQCLGCGRRGHVLAECWRTPVAAGGVGRSSTPRNTESVVCLNCDRRGHWAADCWHQTSATGPQPPRGSKQRTQKGNGR